MMTLVQSPVFHNHLEHVRVVVWIWTTGSLKDGTWACRLAELPCFMSFTFVRGEGRGDGVVDDEGWLTFIGSRKSLQSLSRCTSKGFFSSCGVTKECELGTLFKGRRFSQEDKIRWVEHAVA